MEKPFDWKRGGGYDWKAAFPLVPIEATRTTQAGGAKTAEKAGKAEKK